MDTPDPVLICAFAGFRGGPAMEGLRDVLPGAGFTHVAPTCHVSELSCIGQLLQETTARVARTGH